MIESQTGRHLQTSGLKCLVRDTSGTVALLTGLAAIPIFAFMGLAVDYALMLNRQQTMQQSLDAATMAAAKALQLTGSELEAGHVFDSYFSAKRETTTGSHQQMISANPLTNQVVAEASIAHKSYFMSVLGAQASDIKAKSSAQAGPLDELEISMMLDLSSSMTGWRYAELKISANKFVDILKPDRGNDSQVRIALAPFASGVNAGTFYSGVTDPAAAKTGNTCVPVREGTDASTDAAPGPGSYFNSFVADSNWPCLASKILPLEADANKLHNAIDGLELSQGTEGEIGTAWAWYLLSPKWNSIWPAASAPKVYGAPALRKIAILMTDGENFTRYFPNDTDADARANTICQNMKSAGITIFTIGVGVEASRAEVLLKSCASDQAKYLSAMSDGDLEAAFRSIALWLAPLRLTN